MLYYSIATCILLVYAQIPIIFTQYVEFAIRENGTEGREILNIQSKPLGNIKCTCFGYDSLVDFEIDNRFENFKPIYVLQILFVNCFNNATDHRNYREFSLLNMIEKLRMDMSNLKKIKIKIQDYGIVDLNIFLHDFEVTTYRYLELQNIGFINASYFQKINFYHIRLENAGQINFTDFTNNSMENVDMAEINILNFTQHNLAKFPSIMFITFTNFLLDDSNAFNVPNLFRDNIKLGLIELQNSRNRIILHEDVFVGLVKLTNIRLNKLKLETLPKNIFRDLTALQEVHLKNNYVKHLDPDIFVNNIDLQVLYIGDDEFLYSEELEHLKLGKNTKINLQDVNVKDLKMLSGILKNLNMKQLEFSENSSIWNIDLLDLAQHTTRSEQLRILINNIPFRINLNQVQNSKMLNGSDEQLSQVKTFVFITVYTTIWPTANCVMDTDLFMWYLDSKLNNLSIYIERYKTVFKFTVLSYLELRYNILYIENCLEQCTCYYNPLLHIVNIYCIGRYLKSIPIIPYPSQFTTIDTIKLNLADNLITDISFDLQDDRVLQKLSDVEFHKNPVLKVNLTQEVAHLNSSSYCSARGMQTMLKDQKILTIGDDVELTNGQYLCRISVPNLAYSTKYLRERSKQEIRDVLDSISQNATCS